uniref:RING-type domain-containing protein n=1 Tax=Amphilophus citrinellus TaxID=61819 RepID=A0A3Q0RYJ2_AMPCI
MALTMENGQEAPRECPVCFESVSGAERTLTCRHVFCQDCLAKILVVAQGQGYIVCPLCRHITVLIKQEEARESLAADEVHTQEVPLPLPLGHFQMAPRASAVGLRRGVNWVSRCLRGTSRQVSRQGITVTNRSGPQIFFISDQGRPTTEGGGAVDIAEVEPSECTECRLTGTDFLCLLVAILLFALAWILVSQF